MNTKPIQLPNVHTDWCGNQININDTVLFVKNAKTSATFAKGTVTNIYADQYGDCQYDIQDVDGYTHTHIFFQRIHKIASFIEEPTGDDVYMVPFAYERMGRIPVKAENPNEAWNAAETKLAAMTVEEMDHYADYLPDSEEIDREGLMKKSDGNFVDFNH